MYFQETKYSILVLETASKNFEGNAKPMESDLGTELVDSSSILKQYVLDVGVVIGEGDSTTISTIRKKIINNIATV